MDAPWIAGPQLRQLAPSRRFRIHCAKGTSGDIPATDGDASLAPTPDGHVFVGTGTGVERLDLDVQHWKDAACALAGRPLTRQEWGAYLPGTPYRPACA